MKAWIIFLGLCFSFQSFSQNEPFHLLLSRYQGLPSQTVYSLNEDESGRLLLGTDKGLYRFNGIEFTPIPAKGAISASVTNLRKAAPGIFFANNFNGQLLRYSEGKLRVVSFKGLPEEIIRISIHKELLLVVSLGKAIVYNWKTGKKVANYTPKSKLKSFFVNGDITDEGVTIVQTDGSVFRDGHLLTYVHKHQLSAIINSKDLVAFIPFFGKETMLLKKGNSLTQLRLPFENNPKIHGVRLLNGDWFICSQTGVVCYDPRTGVMQHWFPNYKISDVWQDHTGGYWFATLEKGLLRVPDFKLRQWSGNAVLSIERYNGYTLAGDAYGVVTVYDRSGKQQHVFHPMNNMIEASFLYVHNTLVHTPNAVFDFNTGKKLHQRFEYTKDVICDNDGNWYLAKPYGLIRLDKKYLSTRGAEYGFQDESKVEFLNTNRTNSVSICENGTIAAACIDGVRLYYTKGMHKLAYNDSAIIAGSLNFYSNQLFINSHNSGLIIVQGEEVVRVVNGRNGLKSNRIIHSVLTPGGIFILTDEDLYFLRKGTSMARAFKQSVGIEDVQINSFVVENGTCYMATDMGVLSMPVSDWKYPRPEFTFSGLRIDNHFIKSQPELSSGDHIVQLLFEALAYRSKRSYVFYYRLIKDGKPGTWFQLPASATSLSLNNLAPGYYRVELLAEDKQTKQRSEAKRVFFLIREPWYMTNIAYAGYIVLLILLSSYFWWIREQYQARKYKREVEQRRLKQELAEARLTALRAQMNPHFLYNVLNSIQSLVFANKLNESSYYLGKFADLTRRFLELSSREKVSLQEEIETLITYLELEKLRFGDDFNYLIETDSEIDTRYTEIPTLLIQPFVENSIKHGLLHKQGEKKLTLRFTLFEEELQIEIADNGIGREASAIIQSRKQDRKNSFATGAVKRKIELLNRTRKHPITLTITDHKNPAGLSEGTLVIITIPQDEEKYYNR